MPYVTRATFAATRWESVSRLRVGNVVEVKVVQVSGPPEITAQTRAETADTCNAKLGQYRPTHALISRRNHPRLSQSRWLHRLRRHWARHARGKSARFVRVHAGLRV